MTIRKWLSLGTGLALGLGFFGCKTQNTSQPAPKPPALPAPTEPAPETTNAEPIEHPYMLPPLIDGFKDGDPIVPADRIPETKPVDPVAQLKPILPPAPLPTVLPILEQKPGQIDPLTLPNSVTENPNDGLFYKAGETEPFTGSVVLTHENGQRKFEGFFQAGQRHGKCIGWYENGRKHYEGTFRGGRLFDGHEYWYYADNLSLKLLGIYEGGKMVRARHLDRQGRIFR